MTTAETSRARINIGEFDLNRGGRYRAYTAPSTDTVHLSRIWPDPATGRDIATVERLDSDTPVWAWPRNWSSEQRADAEAKVVLLWRHHQAGTAE